MQNQGMSDFSTNRKAPAKRGRNGLNFQVRETAAFGKEFVLFEILRSLGNHFNHPSVIVVFGVSGNGVNHTGTENRNFLGNVDINIGNRRTHAGIHIIIDKVLVNAITQQVIRVRKSNNVNLFKHAFAVVLPFGRQ